MSEHTSLCLIGACTLPPSAALGQRTDQGAEQILRAARWPGNVRELHN